MNVEQVDTSVKHLRKIIRAAKATQRELMKMGLTKQAAARIAFGALNVELDPGDYAVTSIGKKPTAPTTLRAVKTGT